MSKVTLAETIQEYNEIVLKMSINDKGLTNLYVQQNKLSLLK